MVLVNPAIKEVVVKIVYYGPGLGGKTTNLRYIYENVHSLSKGKMISLTTEGDRTLFFDFLPINLGEIGKYKIRVQLYTVPGQVFYEATRKLVLSGADAVVFVADSQKRVFESNLESLESLKNNLLEKGIKFEDIPIVFQFNKRDLKEIHDLNFLNKELNELKMPFFPAIAILGDGVMETFNKISEMVIKNVAQKIDKDGSFRTMPISTSKPSSYEEKVSSSKKTDKIFDETVPAHEWFVEEKAKITLSPKKISQVPEETKKEKIEEIKIPLEIELKDKESAKFEIKISLTIKRKE